MITATVLMLSMVFFEVPQEIKVPTKKEYMIKYY